MKRNYEYRDVQTPPYFKLLNHCFLSNSKQMCDINHYCIFPDYKNIAWGRTIINLLAQVLLAELGTRDRRDIFFLKMAYHLKFNLNLKLSKMLCCKPNT